MIGICPVYSIYIYGIFSFSGFRGQHHNRPDPVPQDIPDDVLPDPDDLADFELPDPQALIDAFLDGLCKESDHEFLRGSSGEGRCRTQEASPQGWNAARSLQS
jgi:hypothetical protein